MPFHLGQRIYTRQKSVVCPFKVGAELVNPVVGTRQKLRVTTFLNFDVPLSLIKSFWGHRAFLAGFNQPFGSVFTLPTVKQCR